MTKDILGILTLIIGLAGFIPYCWAAATGKAKPHVFSWVIWGILSAVAFLAQIVSGAGAGSWAVGGGAVACFIAAGLGYRHGEKNITRSDWFVFVAALSAVPLWYFTSDPFYSICLVSLINALGLYSTFRKSWSRPFEEPILLYALNLLKFSLAILAMENYNFITVFFPATVLACNASLVLMLGWRRRQVTELASRSMAQA
jgi:hypothetical protein